MCSANPSYCKEAIQGVVVRNESVERNANGVWATYVQLEAAGVGTRGEEVDRYPNSNRADQDENSDKDSDVADIPVLFQNHPVTDLFVVVGRRSGEGLAPGPRGRRNIVLCIVSRQRFFHVPRNKVVLR